MMNKTHILLLLLVFPVIALQAQKILTVDSAIQITLRNNYDILVAKNDAEIAKINNTAGNAGMLPGLSVNAGDNYSYNNVYQELSNGTTIQSAGAHSNAFNAALTLNWTLFDGGRMFVTKNKLAQIEALGGIQFKTAVLQTVYDVIVAYYNVVKQKQQLNSFNEVIALNRERVRILERSFNSGLAPKTDYLQAQIDLNVYREDAMAQEGIIISSKRALNQMLCRQADVAFDVADSIPHGLLPDKNEMLSKLNTTNTSILASGKQVDIAKLSLAEQQRQLFPKLGFTANYNFLRNDNSASTVTLNRTFGPQLGGVLTIPIYQSGNTRRQIRLAGVELKSAGYNLENMKIQMNSQLQDAFTAYEIQDELLKIEIDNKALAKENLSISMERLRLGQTTSLEVRQAQESYQASLTRLTNLQFNLKVAETKLKQLLAQL